MNHRRRRKYGTKPRSPEAHRRHAALAAAGVTIQDVANLAKVSWRFAKYWVDDERTSVKVQAAFDKLTR